MGKKLEITPQIKAAITRSTGDAEFDFSKVSVFETISMNTKPLNKRGIYNKAVTTEQTLHEMASYVNAGSEQSVPLHTMHDQSYGMPIGRVFSAEVMKDDQGMPELRSLFFIGNEHEVTVAGVDNGSIDEVSVGMLPKHVNCSQCGFDYLGAEATSDNIWGQVCNNEHEIGVDGTHLILNGMDRWLEQSIVSLGAAKNAKILSRTKALMGAESYEKLAASGVSPEATVLFTLSTLTPTPQKKPEPKMEIKDLVTLNAALSGEKAVALHQITTLTATNVELTAKITELTTAKTDLEIKLAAVPSDTTKTTADLAAAKLALTEQTTYVRKEADRLAVAAGVAKLPDTATFAEMTASIDANRVKLAAAFDGGRTQGQENDGKAKATQPSPSSYKIRR